MRLRLALLLLTALLVIPAFASPDLVQVPCRRSDGTGYGSFNLFLRTMRVSAEPYKERYWELTVSSRTFSAEQSWNPDLWHFSVRSYGLGINWRPGSSQDAWLSLHEAGLSFSSNLTFLNPNPYYQPSPWSVERSDGNETIEFGVPYTWHGYGPEYNDEPFLKANGVQVNLSLSYLAVRGTLYGGQSGSELDVHFTFALGVTCYNETSQPPPSPPPPPSLPQPRLSWVGFAARTVDGRFALANASFLYQADNYIVYRVTLGSLGALRAYWWNATALQGVWIAETGINWGYQYGYQWRWVGEPAGMRGFYDFGTVSGWAGWIGIYSRPLTGTYLLKLSISVYGDWVELQVEDPPGSGQYVTIVRGTDGGYDDYAKISYNGVLTLNNQRLRIAAYYHSEGYKGDGRMSGYAILFNPSDPSKLAPDAQPVWWEVYREGSLYANITGPSTPRYNGDGSNWRMIAVYQATPSYRLSVRVLTHDNRPANGTIVRVTGSSGTVYVNTTDSNGVALFTLPAGSYSVLINETYYGPTLTAGGQTTNWRRYRFWKWSDESTDNPRTVNLNSDTNLTAYVWDERALLVRWEPHVDGDAWGVLNATSGARIAYDSIVWLKRGQTVQLLPVEAGGLIFTYWRVGTECYRGQPYSSDPLLTLTVGDRGLSAIAVFRLAATNQTMLPPGAGMVNPVTYIPGATMGGEERMGRRGWWLLTVTHVPTGKTSPAEAGIDGRAWIYALIVHENGSSRWVPVTGVWRLQLAQDWDPSKHVKDLPGGVKIIEWNRSTIAGFPKIQEPQEYRDWYFVTLSAWDPLVYEELGGSYDTSGLWLANGSTLALYNITFAYMGVNGDRVEYVYWQPIAVSTLTFRAEARYTLTSHEASLGRRRILMSIYVNATWKYVPPQRWQLLGFRVHAPQLGFLASLEEPGCTGTFCIGYWAPPSQTGATWRLYIIGLGDTEDFYSKAYPRGLLGGDGYSSVREFRISMRWLGAGYHPSTLIWGSDRVTFKLAPASVYKLEWTDPRGPFTVTWGCFAQGSWGLTPISSYTADLTFDWGVLGTNRSCANPARFNGVASPYTVNVQVPADNWIAFYVIPAGGRYEITQDGIVPVPLFAKYPPRG
ncbi:MAG: hypothetical protein QXM71_07965 [Thermofilum sp.]